MVVRRCPQGLEGYYQIDVSTADAAGNYGDNRSEWAKFRGPIDTRFPTFEVQAGYPRSGSAALTQYHATIRDYNLTTENYEFVCPLAPDQFAYTTDPALARFTDDNGNPVATEKLAAIAAACARTRLAPDEPGRRQRLRHARPLQDAAMPAPAVAYIGTYEIASCPSAACPTRSSGPT